MQEKGKCEGFFIFQYFFFFHIKTRNCEGKEKRERERNTKYLRLCLEIVFLKKNEEQMEGQVLVKIHGKMQQVAKRRYTIIFCF